MLSITPTLESLIILWWCLLCIYIGRSIGRTIDIQHREPEGKPNFVWLDRKTKFYNFKYISGTMVVKEGIRAHFWGYCFSVIEFVLFILHSIFGSRSIFLLSCWIIMLCGAVISIGVLLPLGIRYERNMQMVYDYDWITFFQRVLTIYPRRRCRVISHADSGLYKIKLGLCSRSLRLAKSVMPVVVGEKLYAVHTFEGGSPFWTIRR